MANDVPDGSRFLHTVAADHGGTVDHYDVPDETDGGVELIVIADAALGAFAALIPRTL